MWQMGLSFSILVGWRYEAARGTLDFEEALYAVPDSTGSGIRHLSFEGQTR